MKLKGICIVIIAVMFAQACSDNVQNECVFQPDIKNMVQIDIEEYHNVLLDMNHKDSLRQFLKSNPIITNYFLRRSSYPNDSVMLESLIQKFSNPYIDTLQQEVNATFGDLSVLKNELSSAFSHLKYYYPEVKIPKVQTVATGFDFDLFVSDSLIVIGLDYYLGQGATFRPNMYAYVLQRYAPEYIVPSIMLLQGISPLYNRTSVADKTILAEMVSYGKAFYFAKRMIPCAPDSVLIWYTNEEIQGSEENIDIIWTHFVENEILYETNHMVKNKYIDDRPKTYEIGDQAPGRIGTWLGWQIVKKYMDEYPQTELPSLMLMEDPQRLFKASKFKPEKKGFF